MYTVGEFAELSRSTKRTLRYYDEIGLLKPSVILPNGHRLYNDDNLFEISRIQVLKALGLTLQEISPLHKNEDESTWNRVLDEERVVLENQIKALTIRVKLNEIMQRLTSIHGTLNWKSSLQTLYSYFEYKRSSLEIGLKEQLPQVNMRPLLSITEEELNLFHHLFTNGFPTDSETLARYEEFLQSIGASSNRDIDIIVKLQLESKELVPYLYITEHHATEFTSFIEVIQRKVTQFK